jgi:hypothetical protein
LANIYFILTSLETFILLIYSLKQESSPQEHVWLHYSTERLILLAAILLVCITLINLTLQSFRAGKRGRLFPERILKHPGSLWLVMIVSILTTIAVVCLLVQPDSFYDEQLAVYQNLKPVLFWLLLAGLLTFFFTFTWYCVYFIEVPKPPVPAMHISEMNAVLVVFAVSILLKVLLVLPLGFGMLKDVGETKYLYMLQYFNEGIFLNSATEFTTHYPPLYALLLMAAYSIRDFAYEGIKLINAVAGSGLVFPVYFLSRRFFDRRTSLFIIMIASLIPFQFEMPIRLLSENLYFTLLMLAIYLVFTRPADFRFRFTWDCLTGFVLGLLYLTRYISLALIPFLMLAWWLKPFGGSRAVFQFDKQKILHAFVMLFLAGVTYMPWVNVGFDNNLPLSQMLGFGIAADTNPAQLTLLNLLKWTAFYGAYFLLLAAPVLNLVGMALSSFSLRDLADEKNRWILTVLILLAAFSLAVVRHSWRADYNLELPKRLMGRYVIYFVPLFIISAFQAGKSFKRAKYRNLWAFLLRYEGLPLLLVGLSYLLVIRGSLLPVNSEFIHPLISIDGYYIKILGPCFFPLLMLLYTGSNLLLWYGKKGFTQFVFAGLVVYYLVGQPAYIKLMVSEQSSQQMGMQALGSMLKTNRAAEEILTYEILLSQDLTRDELDDVAWTIYIRHPLSEWTVGRYYPEKTIEDTADVSVVLLPLEEAQESLPGDYDIVTINGEPYVLQILNSPAF